MNKCIICNNTANQTGSHIIPINLIKDCIGARYNEISYDININHLGINKNIYIGDELKHKSEEINNKGLIRGKLEEKDEDVGGLVKSENSSRLKWLPDKKMQHFNSTSDGFKFF